MLQPLKISQVSSFLNEHLEDGVQDLDTIGKGQWSQSFSFRNQGKELVARFGEYVDDYVKENLACRFSSPDLPIPHVLKIGQALGRHFCISERAYGDMLEGLDSQRMEEIVPAVLRMFDALREADVSPYKGFGIWGPNGDAPHVSWHDFLLGIDKETERVHGWHAALAESPTGMGPFVEALEYLRSHVHLCPDIRHLLHTDLLHFNVLVAEDRLNAVVDWGSAMYGDFLYELAAFTYYAPWFPAMAGIDWAGKAYIHLEKIGCEVAHFEERLRCYEVHIGLGGMAYSAFVGGDERLKDIADNASRTLRLIRD